VGVPVVAGGVDHSCMSLGAGLDRPERMYLSLGSSNWLTVSTPSPILDTVHHPYVFDHVIDGLYVSALSTFAGGSSISWLAGLFEIDVAEMLEVADRAAAGTGLVVVPTLGGGTVAEGGPDVRGVFAGLDLGHGRGDIARAVVEGVAYSLANTAQLLGEHIALPDEIVAVGGGARSTLLMQTLADVLDRRIVRVPNDQHAAALGAAALGLLGIGAWTDLEPLRANLVPVSVYEPDAARQSVHDDARTLFSATADFARSSAPLVRALRTRSEE
jgi:xylulokinase